jgi:GNAT superfamily N-acetyltransferase
MRIRKVELADVDEINEICQTAFINSVATTLTDQGINTFAEISSAQSFTKRMQQDNQLLVCENNSGLLGVIELKEGRHITMFFVRPSAQHQGVGKLLIEKILKLAREQTVTVNASLTSIDAYRHYGFVVKGAIGEIAGLRYQPMEITLC